MDDMTWTILALLLTGAGGAATWWCFTRRGPLAGATALGWTLLVPAVWLTGLLELGTRVATAFSRWASQLVFSPTFWLGAALGGVAVLTLMITSVLRRKGLGDSASPALSRRQGREKVAPDRAAGSSAPLGSAASRRTQVAAPAEDDLDDIEALLRKRGIE